MKITDMRDKTVDELRANEGDLKREMFNLRFQVVTGEIQNPRRIREARREIARLKTVVAERERQEAGEQKAKQKGAEAPKEEGTK
ncbi:50S ribosomal protein L29 [Nitrospirota bacterium]